ncbi:hemin uptake protein HemP [Cupriavidus sp. UYPR2.512]|uniref:hemin uptake protein HemP n=1 Tax=Cupriavidus sp. UYPR2.512 TaxID=1080187 RepID=UPI00037A3EEF|nr:hemin uptake protein HemP [Cupriavidus sp. UYPR2.512]UIF85141.1 hemin uptake protein HemP [Cupriavidus necator]
MSTLSLPLSQPREVTRRRLSLRRVEVAAQPRREASAKAAPSTIASVKSAVAALPARLEALVRDSLSPAPVGEPVALDAIMHGASTLPILHNGDVYTLRVTRYGKLILTK